MPGMRLERRGVVRLLPGHAVSDWAAVSADGREVGTGRTSTSSARMDVLLPVTGFWNQPG
jgi:hypothetical protein